MATQFRLTTLLWLVPLVAAACVFAKLANSANFSSLPRHGTGFMAAMVGGLSIHRLAFVWRSPRRGSVAEPFLLTLGVGLYFLALSLGGSLGSMFAMAGSIAAWLEVFRASSREP
jgi:hypothetical protein